MAACAWLDQGYRLLLTGKVRETLIRPPAAAHGIYGLELFATVADVVLLGDRFRKRAAAAFLDNNAAAGARIKASSGMSVAPARVAQRAGRFIKRIRQENVICQLV